MEDKFIISQSEDVINYANVTAVYTDMNIEETENGDIEIYLLLADVVSGETYVLGGFESEEQAEKEKKKLISWLRLGKVAPNTFEVEKYEAEV